jgi:sulfur-oxidizing protein SoxY
MKTTLSRRNVLALGAGALTLMAMPLQLLAGKKEAFMDKKMNNAIKELYGSMDMKKSGVKLKAPNIAENGAVVPITVSSDVKNVESIAIFIEKNPRPLVAVFNVKSGTIPTFSTRVKMGKTSKIVVVAKADGKLYSTSKEVKVTIGGCGG